MMIEVTVQRYYRRGERVGPVQYKDDDRHYDSRLTTLFVRNITSVVEHPDRTEIHTDEEGGRQYHVVEDYQDVIDMIEANKDLCSQPTTCSGTCQDT